MAFDKLNLLKAQRERLPASLPNPPAQQSSYQWQIDQDFLSDEGIVAATNQMLERVIGMRAGGITIRERGRGISGVVEVLNAALQEEPKNAIIHKWIDDIMEIDVDQAPGAAIPARQPVQKGSSLSGTMDAAHKKSKTKKAVNPNVKESTPKVTPPVKTPVSHPAVKTSVPAPPSDPFSYVLRDNHIPATASWVRKKQMEYLKTQWNLTSTYDVSRFKGSRTMKRGSIYTFHVTDSHRRTFLIEGDESSAVSHTGEYISSIHQRIIKEIGPDRFVALLSDNAGNTRKGRELTAEAWLHIFNLQDAVHEQQLTILEITNTIETVRRLLQFFHHSTAATNRFRTTLDKLGISRGLGTIGNTRFATVYYACNSVLRCLPALYELIGVDKLVNVLRPFAFSIKCLESAHSTPADVFIYWFGVMSEYEEMFSSNSDELKKKTISDICAIINRRYIGMIKEGPSGDIYITSLFLEPRYRDAAALNQPDPLRRTFTLRRKTGNDDEDLLSSIPIRRETFLRIGKFLCGVLLRREFSRSVSALPEVLNGLQPEFASADLTRQLSAYAKRDYPFNLPIADSECPLTWWRKLQHHSQASLLAHCAVKLLSICANSMADERTMSKVTKLNSHVRNRQEVQTLVDMIQIASYTTFDPEVPETPIVMRQGALIVFM
ncbi:hypothetical protein M407DRAFT_67168 [Tulasnella calospora MUT 4182]|uniref:HAT C-terminal dimerisation domain-containing protein n=1 Tax=Tulasnella calospora MUT 4182 TaxID=1051891 RepID=A0A0C3LDS5_9AGAM|nr:hypothetical protein M407DRAFT_67168 [Tulasnella calospora MUT 4182]